MFVITFDICVCYMLLSMMYVCLCYFPCGDRVPLIAVSWYPGKEEVETQGGNGRAIEGERVSKSVAFVCKMI